MIAERGFRNTWDGVCYIFTLPATYFKEGNTDGLE